MTNAVKTFALPIKITGASWESVGQEFGFRLTGKPVSSQFLHQVELPAGWTNVTSNVSRHQQWLVNTEGTVVAKVFFKDHFDRGYVDFLAAEDRSAKPEVEECRCQHCDCGA